MDKSKKMNVRLKFARLSAGFEKPIELVNAVNAYLEKNLFTYRVSHHTYLNVEQGRCKATVTLAYFVSKAIGIPIEIFITEVIPSESKFFIMHE